MEPLARHPIIIFDGDCVLCSANARFVLEHDRRGLFRLAAMQSAVGRTLMLAAGVDPDDPDTLLLVDGEGLRRNSDAVLAIYEGLGWPWRVMGMARIIPRSLRNNLYRWVARNRYRLFGQRAQCFVPRPEWKERLL